MYQELVDAFIGARNDARQAERGSDVGEWHPSSLSGCPRAAVYDFKGYAKSDPKEMRNIRIMDRGTEVHEVLQKWMMYELGPDLYMPEVKIDTHGIKGSADAILKDGDVWELQEYKSISPMGKRYMSGPKPEHVKQARIYHRCLMEQGYEMSSTIRIVYVDRDDWSVDEYDVDAWLDVEWYEFLGEVADLEDHVMEGTLPPRMPLEYDPKGKRPPKKYWLCEKFCDYRTRCWEEDGE